MSLQCCVSNVLHDWGRAWILVSSWTLVDDYLIDQSAITHTLYNVYACMVYYTVPFVIVCTWLQRTTVSFSYTFLYFLLLTDWPWRLTDLENRWRSKGPITCSIFNPRFEFSPVSNVIVNLWKIAQANICENFQTRAEPRGWNFSPVYAARVEMSALAWVEIRPGDENLSCNDSFRPGRNRVSICISGYSQATYSTKSRLFIEIEIGSPIVFIVF